MPNCSVFACTTPSMKCMLKYECIWVFFLWHLHGLMICFIAHYVYTSAAMRAMSRSVPISFITMLTTAVYFQRITFLLYFVYILVALSRYIKVQWNNNGQLMNVLWLRITNIELLTSNCPWSNKTNYINILSPVIELIQSHLIKCHIALLNDTCTYKIEKLKKPLKFMNKIKQFTNLKNM